MLTSPDSRPPCLWHHNFFLPFICLWTALCSLSINKSLNDVCFLPLTSCFSSSISLLYILLGPALYVLLLLFKEPATSRWLSVLGLVSRVWCSPLLSLLCSQLWWYELPEFLCCLIPLNTTMEQISYDFSCVPGYLCLLFSCSKKLSEIILGDEKEQAVCVSDLQGQSGCSTGIVCAVRQRGRLEEESWKAAPPGGGRLLPPVFMIWETRISLGTGIPHQMPKGRGCHTVLFILILQNSLELWSSPTGKCSIGGTVWFTDFYEAEHWLKDVERLWKNNSRGNVLVSCKYSQALSLVIGEEWILSLWYIAEKENDTYTQNRAGSPLRWYLLVLQMLRWNYSLLSAPFPAVQTDCAGDC